MDNSEEKISEKTLIEKCIAEERKYQEMLYRQHADKMYTVALNFANNNEEDACDILQEGFVKVFRKIDKFRFDCPLEAWIRKIIVNTAIQLYRKKKRHTEVIEDYVSEKDTTINDYVLEKFNANDIMNMVNSLPEKAAMVLKLFAIEGYGHKEIAVLLDISEGTSKSQLNRARFLLKQSITKNS